MPYRPLRKGLGMADKRYLKQRRQGWYVRMKVPQEVRAKFPSVFMERSLRTRDLTLAQTKRWAWVREWTDAFQRARGQTAITHGEIEGAARDYFDRLLREWDEGAKSGQPMFLGGGESFTAQDGSLVEIEVGEEAGLDDAQGLTGEALEADDFRTVASEIEAIRLKTGATIDPGTPAYRDLARALLNATLKAQQGRLAALRGRRFAVPETFGPAAIDPATLRPIVATRRRAGKPVEGDLRFSEAAKKFMEERQRDPKSRGKLAEQTRLQHEAVFRLFAEFSGDAYLSTVSRLQASDFLSTISKLHPNWGRSPKTKGRKLAELVEMFSGGPGLSNRTVNRYVSAMAQVFKWARKRGAFTGESPFTEQSLPKASRRRSRWFPYTGLELTTLMNSTPFKAPRAERIKPTRYDMKSALGWVTLIALFSGMRQNEICQLYTDNVRKEDGVWLFDIHENVERWQSVKREASIRPVPIHSQVIKAGFLKYLDATPPGPLFPGLKPGGPDKKRNWYFTKAFTTLRRGLGINRPRVGFHSLRGNAATALEQARVSENEAAQAIGHEKLTVSYSTYSLGLTPKQLQGIIEKIKYPKLDLTHLR